MYVCMPQKDDITLINEPTDCWVPQNVRGLFLRYQTLIKCLLAVLIYNLLPSFRQFQIPLKKNLFLLIKHSSKDSCEGDVIQPLSYRSRLYSKNLWNIFVIRVIVAWIPSISHPSARLPIFLHFFKYKIHSGVTTHGTQSNLTRKRYLHPAEQKTRCWRRTGPARWPMVRSPSFM